MRNARPRGGAPRVARYLTGIATCLSTPVLAAGLAGPDSPASWAALAALGLAAVAVAAFTLRRSRGTGPGARDELDDKPLGRFIGAPPDNHVQPMSGIATKSASPAPDGMPAAVRTRRSLRQVPLVAAEDGGRDVRAAADDAAYDTGDTDTQPDAAGSAAGRVPADASQLFLALHHVDLSIDVLRRHLDAETRPMPAVWVMLLDLCRTHGREAAFRDIAAAFHARFNVCAPAWDTYPPDRSEPGLEAYPRIVRELTLAWGTHECRRLLDRLLYDNRGGGRRGFTMNAYNDLIALRRAADSVLQTIEQDFAEEAKVRDCYARAANDALSDPLALPGIAAASPLVRDLETQCDADLLARSGTESALEQEHPALAATLAREWGNAGMAGRLCEMLARHRDGAAPLSNEAAEDVEMLRAMAQRLAEANGVTLDAG